MDAIVDLMMERLQRENPDVEYYRKPKKPKKEDVSYQILKKLKKPHQSKLH
jgi:hypothetical protein